MTQFLPALVGPYDLHLVALSTILALLPAYLAFDLANRRFGLRGSRFLLPFFASSLAGSAVVFLGLVNLTVAAAVMVSIMLLLSVLERRFLSPTAKEGGEEGSELVDRQLFSAWMDASPERVYFKDLDGRFFRINKAFAEFLGLAENMQPIAGKNSDLFAALHAGQSSADEAEVIATGQALINREEQILLPGGRISWTSTSRMPLRNSRGEICGVIGVSRDISRRKLAEQALLDRTAELQKSNVELERQICERRSLEVQLVQAQKLESIGQLAAGIAHEINTPIQYVGDNCRFIADSFQQIDTVLRQYADLLALAKQTGVAAELVNRIESTKEDIDLDYLLNEIPRAIEQSNEGVARVAHIVRAMKEFSHPGSARMEAVDLNHAIKSTLTVCRNEWKYVADAITQLDPGLPPVRCLVGEINQVLLNLVVNSAHAIADCHREERGIITVTTRHDGDFAEIRVSDNGIGIPPSIQPRIFDPFFTTKEVGRGSGQGLTLARNVVVKKHNGSLTFHTAAGQGTEFIIRLPIAGSPADEEPEFQPDLTFDSVGVAS